MVTICQKCGDKGFSVALIYCDKCQIAAEHRYCLDILPSTFTEYVTWFCEDCEPYVESSPKTVIPISPRKNNQLSKPEIATSLAKPLNAVMIGRSVKRPLVSRILPKRKNRNGSLKRAKVKKHESSPHQACEANDSEDLNCDQKVSKQRRLTPTDNANIDEKDDSNKLKDHKLEESESNNSLEDHMLEESASIKTNTTQKANQARSSEISRHQNQKLEESQANKLDEAESSKIGVNRKYEQQHISTMEYKDNTDQEAESSKKYITGDPANTSEQSIDVPAQPIVDPVWRGRFSIVDPKFNSIDGLAAHLSTKACLKVCEEARLLPDLLCADIIPRGDIWPKSFRSSEPGDGHIALYFFPENERDERVFDNLVEYMIEEDLGMRAVAVNAELLVFTSIQLPLAYWRFQAKYYLWGVFRRNQASVSRQQDRPQDAAVTVHNNSNESAVTVALINPL